MNLNEIRTKLEKIKTDLNEAFDNGRIDFDKIESEIASAVDGIIRLEKPTEKRHTISVISYELYR